MKIKLIPLTLLLVLLCTGCFGGRTESSDSSSSSSSASLSDGSVSSQDNGPNMENTVTLNGKTYRKRTDIRTVLFLGIDDTKTVEAEGAAVGNQGRA